MSTMHSLARLGLAAWLGLATVGAATAAPEYRVIVAGPAGSAAAAINSAGVVAGSYVPAGAAGARAFINRGQGLVDLGKMGTASAPRAINDKDQVLGNWTNASGQVRGVIWHRGQARDIGIIPGMLVTFHLDINNAGYVVAEARQDGAFRSFLRAPNGALRDIGNLPASDPITNATTLNELNQVTGGSGEFTFPEIPYRAFSWTRGVMRDLGDNGATPNVGNGINNLGQVTGFSSVLTGGPHDRIAFIYTNGRLQDIDGRPPTVDRYSEGRRINNRGHVVGESDHLRGFVYRGRRMQSLNALVDPRPGWDLTPVDINDAGQIAAIGYRNGQMYAVRLDPIRPSLEAPLVRSPEQDDAINALDPPLAPGQAAAEAALDAAARAREVVQPVQQ
jgi:probable HAF family extracellular repeat protein